VELGKWCLIVQMVRLDVAFVLLSMLIMFKAEGSNSYILNYLQNEGTVTGTIFDGDVEQFFFQPLNSGASEADINTDIINQDSFSIRIELEYTKPPRNSPEDWIPFEGLDPLFFKRINNNSVQSEFTLGDYFTIDKATLQSSGTIEVEFYLTVFTGGSRQRISPNNGNSNYKVELKSVPEPSALSLLAVGLGGLALVRRRRS